MIEPGLDYNKLLAKNRRVFSINACLSRSNQSELVDFLNYGVFGGIKGMIRKRSIKCAGDLNSFFDHFA